MTPAAEDQARANFYALLARLFYAPPDRPLLDSLAAAGALEAEDRESPLALAWRDLIAAASDADLDAVREEYDAMFVGTGKADVTLYASAYTVKSAADNPLVELREFLWGHGLARRESAGEPEDHIAGLCETMRHLIAKEHGSSEAQQVFFKKYIWPAANALCGAITSNGKADFYRRVGRFAQRFLELEHTALDMH